MHEFVVLTSVVAAHNAQVQDLKAENKNGLSDPVVYVEALGKKKHTKVCSAMQGVLLLWLLMCCCSHPLLVRS